MTVFIRASAPEIQDETTPACPTLARLSQKMVDENIAGCVVDQQVYCEAEAEMTHIRKLQGYSDIARAQLPQRNFLLFGCPIVCGD